MEFPLGVFSIALATVILPGLSRHHAAESMEHFTATLDWALRLVILLVSPAAVAMLVFAGPLTATTFGYGEFDAARRAHGELRADGVFVGPARLQPGQGAGAGLLRAPGHAARRCASASSRSACNMALNVAVVLPAQYFGFPVSAHPASPPPPASPRRSTPTLLWRGLVRAGRLQGAAGLGRAAGAHRCSPTRSWRRC